MRLKSTNQAQHNFHMRTRCTIGPRALDQIGMILHSHGSTHPLWLLPSEASHQKIIRNLLKSWYLSHPYDAVDINKVEDFVSDLSADHLPFDSIVACGNATCIDQAKLLAHEAHTPSENEITKPKRSWLKEDSDLIVVPFGLLDGLECQGRIRSAGTSDISMVPAHAIFDGRLCRLTSSKAIARTMCRSLQEVMTSVLYSRDHLIRSVACSAFDHAYQAMKLLQEDKKDRNSWMKCSLAAGATLHAGGVCAQNRGFSIIIEFSETLAIEGFADYHQTAAALLPVLLRYLQRSDMDHYLEIKGKLGEMEPMDFIRFWIDLSEPRGTDRIINRLCGDTHALLNDPNHIREVQPLLGLCSSGAEE